PECYLTPEPDEKIREQMGTGSGRPLQNKASFDDRPAPVPICSDDTGVTILHVGRLDRGKGIEVLANAIPSVLAKVPSCRFVFIGDDCSDGKGSTWRKRLESQLAAAGVDKQVTFLGGLDQLELNAWYRKADIAVVPSLIYESFSYTCAQAAAAGLPVIASRIG